MKIETFKAWKCINGEQFSIADYVFHLFDQSVDSIDFFSAFDKFMHPQFRIYGGRRFNESIAAFEKYSIFLSKGLDEKESYYWSNSFDVSGFFQKSSEDTKLIARRIRDLWNNSLPIEHATNPYILIENDEDVLLVISESI